MSKPSWASAPDWAEWVAMDKDGAWAWFEIEPEWDDEAGIWLTQHPDLRWELVMQEPDRFYPDVTLEARP